MAGEYELGDLSGVLGGDLYNNLFGSMGYDGVGDGFNYSGDMSSPWMEQAGWNEGSNPRWSLTPTQNAMGSFDNYTFNWQPQGGVGGLLTAFDPSGQQYGQYQQKDEDNFTKLMGMVAPMIATSGFGGALSGMFGGGATGGALGHGLAQGTMSSMQGGSFGKGALSGAISGGMAGLGSNSPASLAGIDNKTYANMFNRGIGSTLGSLATGNSGEQALKSGLMSAGTAGLNSLGKSAMTSASDMMNTWLAPEDEFGSLQGSGGDMSGMTDVSPNRYDEFMMGPQTPDGGDYYNPDYRYAGDQSGDTGFTMPQPQQTASSFSLPSVFGGSTQAASSSGLGALGRFAGNNFGDLATMLYGIYNNRRQRQAIGDQMNSLQSMMNQATQSSTAPAASLFGQNSPYAQQLRAKLNAQAAATGRRSNISGRETQLQAMLADRNAQVQSDYDRNRTSMVSSLAPQLAQLRVAQGGLQNSLGSNLVSMLNRTGAFNAMGRGLQNMFAPQPSLTGPGSFDAYKGMDDMYGMVG